MKIEEVKIDAVKLNDKNPRIIKDDKFKKLVKSIQEFPEMLKIRPIVVDEGMVVLGGNMRLRACQEAGLKKVFIIKASELTEQQKKQFVIKDNVTFGEWDWETISNEWDEAELSEWGFDVPNWNDKLGYFADAEELDTPKSTSPKGTDDDYSTFELVMLYENKLKLLDTLNSVKQEFLFEKLEDALMEILRQYGNQSSKSN